MAQDMKASISVDALHAQIGSLPKEHPRLIADAATFRLLRESLGKSSSTRNALAQSVLQQADKLHDVPPITRKLQGRRLLGQSRRCLGRMLNLSMAYQLTGDRKYVERGKQEMLTVAGFNDWNPSHFLDVAEMTLAMGIGYDWMFEALDDTSRIIIREAIKQKGVSLPFQTEHNKWVRATNNWGQVCHCGLVAGALAILEDESMLAAMTVHNAIQNIPRSMKAYDPHGSYPEGPSYWAYGTSFNVVLVAMLESVLGSDFNLSKATGFDQTGQYLRLMTGPSGETFNYADGGARRNSEAVLYWFAHRYHHPDWLLGEDERLRNEIEHTKTAPDPGENRLLPLALLWMSSDRVALDSSRIVMPLHWESEGSTPVSVHRSSWTAPNAVFVGIKAGSPSSSHGQMDIGSFVLDADGERWAMDLGAEGYHGIESRGMNLWSSAQDSDRWTIFRQSNAGHNTLVIDGKLQVAKGFGSIVSFADDRQFPNTVIDLTPMYEGQAANVLRGVALLPSNEVLLQDELKGLAEGSIVRWGMITPAKVNTATPSTLLLQQDGQQLTLTIVEPKGAIWSVINTQTPRHEWDSPNPGTSMVAFEAASPPSGDMRMVVIATPGSCKTPSGTRRPVMRLANWK
jgi:hypothetical protein